MLQKDNVMYMLNYLSGWMLIISEDEFFRV